MVRLTSADLSKSKAQALVVPVCEDQELFKDTGLKALTDQALRVKEFKGGSGEKLTLHALEGYAIPRGLFFGLGTRDDVKPEMLRVLAGKAVAQCCKAKLTHMAIALPPAKALGIDQGLIIEALLEGAALANYHFDRYQKTDKQRLLKQITLYAPSAVVKKYKHLAPRTEAICRGTHMAREWVNMPPNDKRPAQLARDIVKEARKAKLKITVLDEKALKQHKCGALLAVAAGSRSKPRLVILDYHPRGAKKTFALVGKGVTFDTGGINLKPSNSLLTMKCDMAGAAATAATILSIAALKPKYRVIAAMPIVENMPSGSATRPGDIVTSYTGKTIEIGNTDAEGRLILIDAMAYVIKKYKPHTLLDMATLTGACLVALGSKIAGVFSSDDTLAQEVIQAGEKTFERCWRLPLPEDYKELLKSDFADISNMPSTRYGAASTAALFLSEFVGDTRWAHIDIAGPAFAKKGNAYCGPGGTGFGVRLLCEVLDRLAA